MVSPTATCELWLDGTRVPDAGVDVLAGRPTALSGLTMTWGRDGPHEQPGPATMTVDVRDNFPDADFLDQLHVGSEVALWAEGAVTGADPGWGPDTYDPQQSTWTGVPDGLPPARSVAGVDITGTPNAQTTGRIVGERLAFWSVSAGTAGITVPPRPFSPTGQLPDAWDDLPKASVGETWRFRVTVTAPVGVQYQVYPAGFRQPYGSGGLSFSFTPDPPRVDGDGTPRAWDITVTFTALSEPIWPAVRVLAYDKTNEHRTWAEQTGTWAQQTRTWDDPYWDDRIYLDNLNVNPPAATSRRVLSFSGAVSDVKAVPDGAGLLYTITAADLAADLGNTVIGDTPWGNQTVTARANRVAELAGITTTPRVRVDPPLDALRVAGRDVDAQPAAALLQDLATTAGGVLWAATHAVTGAFLWIENPDNRAAVAQLEMVGGIVTITGAAANVTTVSACDLLLEPVAWLQDTGDVATVVAVTWLEEGSDGSGEPTTTERTVTVADQDSIDGTGGKPKLGTRRLSISTELSIEADAIAYANRALAQARAVGWRVEGLTLDTATMPATIASLDDTARQIGLMRLLDGTTRMGLALTLADMPAYAPRGAVSSYYVEGGRYTYTGGAWTLSLVASPSAGQGESVTWTELDPGWAWNEMDPTITWQDLYGVSA